MEGLEWVRIITYGVGLVWSIRLSWFANRRAGDPTVRAAVVGARCVEAWGASSAAPDGARGLASCASMLSSVWVVETPGLIVPVVPVVFSLLVLPMTVSWGDVGGVMVMSDSPLWRDVTLVFSDERFMMD